MAAPTARQLKQRARAIAAQMRDPEAKRIMTTLALTYERLATFAALRESDKNAAPDEGEVA